MIILDTETTGTDVHRDQVLELCIQFPDGTQRTRRFRPTIPIPAEATKVHGITDEDVKDCSAFAACAKSIAEILDAADVIVAFNAKFDFDILQAEFDRCGMQMPLNAKWIDPLRLWHHHEPRTLGAAHARFAGSPLEHAHSAAADTAATGRVLAGMLAHWGVTLEQAAELGDPFVGRENWIGPTSHVQTVDGVATFMFGKVKGVPVSKADAGYLRWVLEPAQSFPRHVRELCEAELKARKVAA